MQLSHNSHYYYTHYLSFWLIFFCSYGQHKNNHIKWISRQFFFLSTSIYKYSGFATRIQMIAAATIITISSIHGSKRNYNYFYDAVDVCCWWFFFLEFQWKQIIENHAKTWSAQIKLFFACKILHSGSWIYILNFSQSNMCFMR